MSHGKTNALAQASSAYLRSAMHQPIQWNEWGQQALERAQRENKPILLDIGAVWCHWCHVMDRESYDDPKIAAIINEHYVPVKVDRDERPDVDARYQAAIHAISGQGGWPLTAFLTPDGRPFWGGTYFPPENFHNRPGFRTVLLSIAQAYVDKHAEVLESAEGVMAAISAAETFAGRSTSLNPKAPERMLDSALHLFDERNGGFGSQPKFQHASAMDVVLDRYARSGDERLKPVFAQTLNSMALGGVYDQLAGGFHRYSVDERWIVPHFEKMAYDNSELLKNYVHAWQVSGEPLYAAVARDIIRWMDEWLSDRERGGFYGSQDADYSMDDDGDYFTWTWDEAKAELTADEFEVARMYYNIRETGDMHHNPRKCVLHIGLGAQEIATQTGKSLDDVRALVTTAKEKLYAARLKRPTPYVDKTVYAGWNSLCISAYLAAARVLQLDDAQHFALRSLDRILADGWSDDGLLRVIAYSDPKAPARRVPAVLEDYAYTVNACLDAYEATADMSYFNFARKIAERMIEQFYDSTGGGFYDAPSTGEQLGALAARRKPLQDTPTPAGNSAAASALQRLYTYSNEPRYRDLAEETLEAFAGVIEQYGIYAGAYIQALIQHLEPYTQVVVVGSGAQAEALVQAALQPFSLNKSVIHVQGENEAVPQNLPPALAETIPNLPAVKEGRTVAILCSGFACQPPIDSADELAQKLQAALKA